MRRKTAFLRLFRLALCLVFALAAGPRPALAAGGEVICGLGYASYDFESAKPVKSGPQPGELGCDNCLAGAPALGITEFVFPPAERIAPAPALRFAVSAPPRPFAGARYARAPPL